MNNFKLITRPSLSFEKIETIDAEGNVSYIAGPYHWHNIIIESEVAPSGDLAYTFVNSDSQDSWKLEQVEALNNIGNNQWECKFVHARMVID